MSLRFASHNEHAIPLYFLSDDDVPKWKDDQNETLRNWVEQMGFTGAVGQGLAVPGPDGVAAALVGFGNEKSRARGRFHLAAGLARLPKGDYALQDWPEGAQPDAEALGALLSGYVFDRYKSKKPSGARLLPPPAVDIERVTAIAEGEALTRDLINTPASDMGPAELETAARDLAETNGASISVITGQDLLAQNFPMIHAVGRASPREPRLIDLRWGKSGPTVTLVGKGVCFDTGGLNLKPGGSMGLMKKDMGGAATVLGLAAMLMGTKADIQLRVLIPAVENSVSGNAFRPQDVLTSRCGKTVEINNTDAEGRLVLADALALAVEESPDLLVSMATLTGAARVAVGPDLAPFYTNDPAAASALAQAAEVSCDPVWQMPFHDPYETMIEPDVADLDNAPKGGFAGSITAALFLRRFTADHARYMHFDIYGWQPSDAPARPKGGVGQGARALMQAMPEILGG